MDAARNTLKDDLELMKKCSLCIVRAYREHAKRHNKQVIIMPAQRIGIEMYVVPRGKKIKARQLRKSLKLRRRYCKFWFWNLPKKCQCYQHERNNEV